MVADAASNKKNIALDGLRGLAAIAVIFAHCFHAFFPYLHTGNPGQLSYSWEALLFDSPFYFIYAGGFAVSLFFVLSGYVLSKKYFEKTDSSYLLSSACKRFFRLGIPVLGAVIISYFMMVGHSFSSVPKNLFPSFAWDAYRGSYNLSEALSEGIYRALVYGSAKYDYVLWTIQVEFIGSLCLFAFLALFGTSKYIVWIAAVLALILLPTTPDHGKFFATSVPGTYLVMFLVGALINKCKDIYRKQWIAGLAFVLGLFISSYKSNVPMYAPLVDFAIWMESVFHLNWDWSVLYELIAAWLIVTSVIASPRLHRAFSAKPIAWTGKVSFSVYLIHTLILGSAGCAVFKLSEKYFSYETSALLAIVVVFATTMCLSELFWRMFDRPAIKIASRIGRFSVL